MALLKQSKGQSSIEIVIALGLFVMFMTVSFSIFGLNSAQHMSSEFRSQAENVVREGLEATRQIKERDWALLTPGAHGLARVGDTWNFSGSQDVTDGKYTRVVTVAVVNNDTIDVTSTVTWAVLGTRATSLTVTNRLTNFRNVEIWGNWGTPQVVASLDIGPQGQATGVAYANNHIYVTAKSSSGKRPSLYSINVNTPSAPYIASSITTNDNAYAVAASAVTAKVFTGAETSGSQVRAFDITDAENPSQLSSIGATGTVRGIVIEGNLLYACDDAGLVIYDVSNPSSPVLVSQLNLGIAVNGLAVKDSYVYLATSSDSQEFVAVDARVPSAPVSVWSYDAPGSHDGLSASIRGNRVYFGTANNSSGSEFHVFNRTNPASPAYLESIDVNGDINDIMVVGNWLFVATSISNEEFKVYRVNSNGIPVYNTGMNLSQVATGLDFYNNTLYVTLRSNDAVQVIQPAP